MDFQREFRRFRCPGLVVLALVLLTAAVGAQTGDIRTTDTAWMEFEPDRVVRGSRFSVRIRTSIPWTRKADVTVSRPELPRFLVWWGYPDAQPWSELQEDGSYLRMVEIRAVIRVDAPGFYDVGPFVIRSGDKAANSGLLTVIGLEPDEADLPYPVFTQWRNAPETVWQGQAVPLVLEGLNFASLALADSVTLAAAPDGLLEEAPGLGGIVTRPYGTEVLYDVPMASWIWTQDETGTYRFPLVQMDIGGMRRSTPGFEVEVLPVPEAALSTGAVGRFQVTYQMEPGPYRVGDVVSLRVRVEGEGNFNILNPPVPRISGAELVGQGSSSSYIPGSAGYRGWREERYDYQIGSSGRISYTIPGWTWFDPTGGGSVRRSPPETDSIEVDPAPEDAIDENRLSLLGDGVFRYPAAFFHWRNTYWFLLALPGFIVLTVLFLLKRPAAKTLAVALILPLMLSASNEDGSLALRARMAADRAESGSWEQARSSYQAILEETGEFPGLLHDLAIVEMELGRPDLAVAYMRRANRLRPGSPFLKDELRKIEYRLALDDQMPLALRIPPAVVFGLLLASINLAFLMAARLLYHRDARTVILTLSMVLVLAASVTGTLILSEHWDQPGAVVRTDAVPLRKIPGPLATDWIQLQAGTAVSVIAGEGDDLLVRTGYGLEGWLPADSVIQITGDARGF